MTASSDAVLHPSALAAVARTRAIGLHFWGQLLGISVQDARDDATVLRLESTCAAEVPALATLADVGLGFAVRRRAAGAHRLATTTLAVEHLGRPAGAAICRSRLLAHDGDAGRALAGAEIRDEAGSLVALARAWFLVLPVPPGAAVTPMPWERAAEPVPDIAGLALTAEERSAAASATVAFSRSPVSGLGVCGELLGLEWTSTGPDHAAADAVVGPHLANRVGDVQGGALYGMAAAAAARIAGAGMELAEGTVQYLRPGRGNHISVKAEAARRGRHAEFVDATVQVDGRAACTARFTLLLSTQPG